MEQVNVVCGLDLAVDRKTGLNAGFCLGDSSQRVYSLNGFSVGSGRDSIENKSEFE